MNRFSQLFHLLDTCDKSQDKIYAMAYYLDQAGEGDKLWMISLFLGKKPGRIVTAAQLRHWAMEVSDLPEWLFKASFEVTKDWNETLAGILPLPEKDAAFSLEACMKLLEELKEMDTTPQKETIFSVWEKLGTRERWVFNKLLTGGFRPGISRKQLIEALALHTGLNKHAISLRLKQTWHPEDDTFESLFVAEQRSDELLKIYPFCMPSAWTKSEQKEAPSNWLAEWNWSGIRAQLMAEKKEGYIWDQEEILLTTKFPELMPVLEKLPDGTVLDGVVLAWKDGVPLSKTMLTDRLKRKNVPPKLLKTCPAHFMAFDLLKEAGKDIREQPLHVRREKLVSLLDKLDLPELIGPSEIIDFETWQQLEELRQYARNYRTQGFVMKRKDSPYGSDNSHENWKEWKADLLTIKGVLIYAEREARRSSRSYAHFSFALWQAEELIPFAKTEAELPGEELRELEAWIRAHTMERFGPVRSVPAKQVFEIGFEGIVSASRPKSGVKLLAPRILSWEKNTPAEEIDSMEVLMEMLARYG